MWVRNGFGFILALVLCSCTSRNATPHVASSSAALISYDEAMQKPVVLGDITKKCKERQLSDEQVSAELDAHLQEMFDSCVIPEFRRGAKLETVTVDVAILGDGSVSGATVTPGSARFQRCIRGIVENVDFPSFAAPRMGARYQFHTS
jgi:hypothetical protein